VTGVGVEAVAVLEEHTQELMLCLWEVVVDGRTVASCTRVTLESVYSIHSIINHTFQGVYSQVSKLHEATLIRNKIDLICCVKGLGTE
jgi:hypothetical protein